MALGAATDFVGSEPEAKMAAPLGTGPSVHLECEWKPGTDRVPPATSGLTPDGLLMEAPGP